MATPWAKAVLSARIKTVISVIVLIKMSIC